MKNKILLTAISFMAISHVWCQQMFQKTFGGASFECAYMLQITPDGGFIMVGQTDGYGAGLEDFYLLKTDSNGELLWTKTYGESNYEDGYALDQTFDGGFVIAGVTVSFGAGNAEACLIKTDGNGNETWTRTYGGSGFWEDIVSVKQCNDSGFVMAGHTTSFGAGDRDMYLIRTNVDGDTLWTRTFGDSLFERGYSVKECSDGGFIVVGNSTSFTNSYPDMYVVRTDINGQMLWSKTYGGSNWDEGFDVLQTSEGGFIFVGFTASFGSGNRDVLLIKTDVNGDTTWTKVLGGSERDQGFCIEPTSDQGYIISGTTNSFGAGSFDAYLIKTNNMGELVWSKTYGGDAMDEGFYVKELTGGGYIMTGLISVIGSGGWDVYLVKTDSIGNSGCNETNPPTIMGGTAVQVVDPLTIISSGTFLTMNNSIVDSGGVEVELCLSYSGIQENNDQQTVHIFPNPFNYSTTFQFDNPENNSHTLSIYDINGRLIRAISGIITNEILFDRQGLIDGLYFFRLVTGTQTIASGKLILND